MFWKSSKLLSPLHLLINWLKARLFSLKYTLKALGIKGWIYVILFLSGPIISGVFVGVKMFTNYLPTGDDPGNWLKRINAFFGDTYPLWGEGLLSYPPLFHMIGAFLTLFSGDTVMAMKVSALLALMSIPITSGWFAYKISGNRQASAITSLIVSFLPMHYEMIWWGAYPNLLGATFLPIGVYATIRAIEEHYDIKNLVNLVLFTSLITLTHHMTAIVFAGIFLISLIILLFLRVFTFRIWAASMLSLTIIIAYTAYLVRSGYLIENPLVTQVDLYEKLLWAFKSPLVLYILIISSILGILKLIHNWNVFSATLLSAWILSPILLALSQYMGVGVDVGRFMLFLGTPMAISSSMVLPDLKEALKVSKTSHRGDNGPEYSIEISIDKILPVILIITVLALTPLAAISTNDSAYEYYDWLSKDYRKYSDQERLQILQWIKKNTATSDVIVASYHLGRWIEGFSSRRTLMDIPLSTIVVRDEFYRSLSAQTILSSNYKVANGYFMIDDQSPLAPTFAPLIYVSNKWGYDPILYLDDSFVRFNFERDGKTWIEAPFKAWLYDSSIEKGKTLTRITHSYQTIALRINKTTEIMQIRPYFSIHYDVAPATDAKLKEAQITFFLAWGRIIKDFKIVDNGFRLSTGTGEVIVTLDKKLSHVEAGIYEEFNQHRVFIKMPLKPEGDSFTITFNNPNPVSQYPQNWLMSFTEVSADFKPRYIVVPKEHPFHKTRTWTPPYPSGEVVYVEDALVRVAFSKAGASWVEAPYRGNVTHEEVVEDGRVISYETVGLIFHKEVRNEGDGITISYRVEPKPGVKIDSIQVPIWQAWGRQVSYVNISGGKALVVSDAGSVLIEVDKDASLSRGLDPEFKAPRILAFKRAVENKVEVSIRFRPLNHLSYLTYEYVPTTRPHMAGGDRVNIINESIRFEPVFETSNIIIYEIKWPRT
jgi:hypothetical protein